MTDTALKRMSAISINLPWRGTGYFPTGTIDAGERAALGFLYSGIPLSDGVLITGHWTLSAPARPTLGVGSRASLRPSQ